MSYKCRQGISVCLAWALMQMSPAEIKKMQGSHVIKLKLAKHLFYSMMISGKMLNWTIKSVQAHIPGRLL